MNTSVDHDTAALNSASPDVNSSNHTDGTGQVNRLEVSRKMAKKTGWWSS